MLADPDGGPERHPFPVFTPTVRRHSPQADVAAHHSKAIGKGHVPHSHVILEDMPFEEKQKLGAHIDQYHSPDWRGYGYER